jgi:hypothetical protein
MKKAIHLIQFFIKMIEQLVTTGMVIVLGNMSIFANAKCLP